jgi:hypothetical protein
LVFLVFHFIRTIITHSLSRKLFIAVNISRSFVGEEDVVRCHYCDGGLRHWEPGDVPWEEHAKWFSFCKYVIKMKGRDFIDNIKAACEVCFNMVKLKFSLRHSFLFSRLPLLHQTDDLILIGY